MKSDLSHDYRSIYSPFILSDNFEFNSLSPQQRWEAFSQSGVVLNYFQPQILHDPSCSPFVQTFSRGCYSPFINGSRIESAKSISQFEIKRVNELPNMPTLIFNSPQKESEVGSNNNEAITKNDIGQLCALIKEHKSANKTKRDWVKSRTTKKMKKETQTGAFLCKHCGSSFSRSQALGGHMSRAHPGKSGEYKKKKDKRKSREVERLKLLLAKRKYFAKLEYDYDELLNMEGGKKKAQKLIDRAAIKKIKSELSKEEINNFFENKILDEIKQDP